MEKCQGDVSRSFDGLSVCVAASGVVVCARTIRREFCPYRHGSCFLAGVGGYLLLLLL